jgi:hypothetical protein
MVQPAPSTPLWNTGVELYSGTRYAERPIAVIVAGQRLPVAEVLGSWRTPAGPGFDVLVTGGQRLRLQFDEAGAQWTVTELSR